MTAQHRGKASDQHGEQSSVRPVQRGLGLLPRTTATPWRRTSSSMSVSGRRCAAEQRQPVEGTGRGSDSAGGVRWKRPTAGATNRWPPTPVPASSTSSKPVTAPTPASRTASAAARPPAWTTARRPPRDQRRLVHRRVIATDLLCWFDCCASTPRWPTPNPRHCATGCCTPPPGSSAANANGRSKSRRTGPGPPKSPPRSNRLRPDRTHLNRHTPHTCSRPEEPTGPWNRRHRRDRRPPRPRPRPKRRSQTEVKITNDEP